MKTIFYFMLAMFVFACSKSPVDVPENQSVSTRSTFVISGKIVWEHDTTQGVGLVTVKLTGPETQTIVTSATGLYSFSVSAVGTYTITPTKTVNLLNGVTGVGGDATLIQQHVAFINLLPTAYKIVAADANKSNSISTLDASIVNQAFLGNPSAQNILNPSWTFVDRAYVFGSVPPIPNYPKSKTFNVASSDVTQIDFVGIKRGDVNGTANPSL